MEARAGEVTVRQLRVYVPEGYPAEEVRWPGEPALFELPELDVQVMEVLLWSAIRGWVALTPVRRGWPGRTEVLPSDLMAIREQMAAGRSTAESVRAVLGPISGER